MLEDGRGIRKLNAKFCRQFRIIKKNKNVTSRLELSYPMIAEGIHETFCCRLLNPFVPAKFERYHETFPPIQLYEQAQKYEVEETLDSQKK